MVPEILSNSSVVEFMYASPIKIGVLIYLYGLKLKTVILSFLSLNTSTILTS